MRGIIAAKPGGCQPLARLVVPRRAPLRPRSTHRAALRHRLAMTLPARRVSVATALALTLARCGGDASSSSTDAAFDRATDARMVSPDLVTDVSSATDVATDAAPEIGRAHV